MSEFEDIGDLVLKLKTELSEFMTLSEIKDLGKDAENEMEIARKMYGTKRDDNFYTMVFTRACLHRYQRAKKLCIDFMKDKDMFYGFLPIKSNEPDGFIDTRENKIPMFVKIPPLKNEQIKNRVKNNYGSAA